MASITYTLHSNNQYSLPYTLSAGSARYFLYCTSEYLTNISSVSISRNISGGTYNVRFCWTNSTTRPEYGYNSDNYSSGRPTGNIILSNPVTNEQKNNIIASFNNNKQRQFIVIRVGNTGSSNITITSFTITINGTVLVLDQVSAGDPITVDNMSALKTYIDERGKTNAAAQYTITLPTAGNAISASNWSTFITKANALPYVSGLTAPSQYAAATAAYYNNIVTKLKG